MTQLTMSLAATHDHWREERAFRHVAAATQLWWRHISRITCVQGRMVRAVATGGLLVAELIAKNSLTVLFGEGFRMRYE
jgi:hypothetical protein